MTHNDRLQTLEALNWQQDETAGRHQICAERCVWIMGSIGGVSHSAWMSEVSGMVYLHAGGAPEDRDFEFDACPCCTIPMAVNVEKIYVIAKALCGHRCETAQAGQCFRDGTSALNTLEFNGMDEQTAFCSGLRVER